MSVKDTSRRLTLPKRLSDWALVAAYLAIIGLSLLFINICLSHIINHGEVMIGRLLGGLVGVFLGTWFLVEQFAPPHHHRTTRARVRFSKRRRSGSLL